MDADLGACLAGAGEPFEPELEGWVHAILGEHSGGGGGSREGAAGRLLKGGAQVDGTVSRRIGAGSNPRAAPGRRRRRTRPSPRARRA